MDIFTSSLISPPFYHHLWPDSRRICSADWGICNGPMCALGESALENVPQRAGYRIIRFLKFLMGTNIAYLVKRHEELQPTIFLCITPPLYFTIIVRT
ncbi:MAG: hypothetical protein GY820_03990 [Gammaproteobacteria bacterium]|nr:hypothetical protein [Gammaproteobacteria bacterium]